MNVFFGGSEKKEGKCQFSPVLAHNGHYFGNIIFGSSGGYAQFSGYFFQGAVEHFMVYEDESVFFRKRIAELGKDFQELFVIQIKDGFCKPGAELQLLNLVGSSFFVCKVPVYCEPGHGSQVHGQGLNGELFSFGPDGEEYILHNFFGILTRLQALVGHKKKLLPVLIVNFSKSSLVPGFEAVQQDFVGVCSSRLQLLAIA